MAFWESAIGGSLGDRFRIRVNADLLGQEVNNNRSLVRFSAYLDKVSTHGGSAIFNSSYGASTNRNGVGIDRSGGAYNFPAGFVGRALNFAINEDIWVYHDSVGNGSAYFDAWFDGRNGPFLTSGSTGGWFNLPQIPRYTTITSFTRDQITDTSFRTNVSVSNTSDILQYSLNSGAWTTTGSGAFTSRSFILSNLRSETTYTIRVRARRQDSGLYTESGTASVTTLNQNKFFDFDDF